MFQQISPQFGAKFTQLDFLKFQSSNQFNENQFFNEIETPQDMSFSGGLAVIRDFIKGVPNREPSKNLEIIRISPDQLNLTQDQHTEPRLIWFGHSSFLVQMGGKNLLFDPVFSDVPAPHPWLGVKRYSNELPITPEELPEIDAVLISHDHYDHLDYASITKLKAKTKHFFVPLGVGKHLAVWGVDPSRITELDWWEEQKLDALDVVLTPARHFSGRRMTNRNKTLWGGWLVKSDDHSLFFSGDSGYGPHFKQVSERYGDIDFALLECGQYNEKWPHIHMMPEQTVQAAQDLNARVMMPVHWGAFTLSLHQWTDPVERAMDAAKEMNQTIVAPHIGEILELSTEPKSRPFWWQHI